MSANPLIIGPTAATDPTSLGRNADNSITFNGNNFVADPSDPSAVKSLAPNTYAQLGGNTFAGADGGTYTLDANGQIVPLGSKNNKDGTAFSSFAGPIQNLNTPLTPANPNTVIDGEQMSPQQMQDFEDEGYSAEDVLSHIQSGTPLTIQPSVGYFGGDPADMNKSQTAANNSAPSATMANDGAGYVTGQGGGGIGVTNTTPGTTVTGGSTSGSNGGSASGGTNRSQVSQNEASLFSGVIPGVAGATKGSAGNSTGMTSTALGFVNGPAGVSVPLANGDTITSNGDGTATYTNQSTGAKSTIKENATGGFDFSAIANADPGLGTQWSTQYGFTADPNATPSTGTPTSGTLGKSTNMTSDALAWLSQPKNSDNETFADGDSLVNNGDGTATYYNKAGGNSVTIAPDKTGNFDFNAIAQEAPGLAAQWQTQYGFGAGAPGATGNNNNTNTNTTTTPGNNPGGFQPGTASTVTNGTAPVVNADGSITPGTPPVITAGTPGQVTPPSYNAAQTVFDRTTMTAEGRISGILSDPSLVPELEKATTASNQAFQGSGTLWSSMAGQGADQAVLQYATPIAEADAPAVLSAAQANTNALNQAYSLNAQLASTGDVANLNADTQNLIAQLQSQTTLAQESMSTDSAQAVATLNSMVQVQVATINQSNALLIQTSSSAATAYANYLAAVQGILNNNGTDTDTKESLLTEAQNTINQTLLGIGKIANVTLPPVTGAGSGVASNTEGSTGNGTPT